MYSDIKQKKSRESGDREYLAFFLDDRSQPLSKSTSSKSHFHLKTERISLKLMWRMRLAQNRPNELFCALHFSGNRHHIVPF